MKIGFDGKRAVQNYTGLGNYSRFVIDILSEYYRENRYIIYAPRRRGNDRLSPILWKGNVTLSFPASCFWKRCASLWRVWGIGKEMEREGLSLFHGLSNELPLTIRRSGIKSVVTIHDLIFLRYPQFYTWIDRHIYACKFRKACKDSDRIIAVSERTKRDIMAFFGTDGRKIDVVYQNCHPSFQRPASDREKEEVRSKYALPGRFILNVGSMESRKNLLLVVKSLEYVPDDVHLVAIGKRTAYTGKVEEYVDRHGLNRRVRLLHDVPFREFPVFYQLAELFVYPSFFEGFGIPVIEALHSGTPVIAATGSCLEEAGGEGSVYIDPHDERMLAENINRILSSPETADEMRRTGKAYVQRFSDEAIARDLMRVYQKVLDGRQ